MHIPSSTTKVDVRVIDTTSHIICPFDMVHETIKGNESLSCPSFSFLVEHHSGRKLLFDLGLRKDWNNLAPPIQAYFKKTGPAVKLSVEKEVHEILGEHGVDTSTIEAIIWSHWHYDHTGNPATFGSFTSLIVGPGVKNMLLPGHPSNPQSPLLDSDVAGREVVELDFGSDKAVEVGPFNALDYFDDGSFYILDTPGHTIGHLSALARVTVDPPSFIMMGADACHHSAEMRPSAALPLPSIIAPNPLKPESTVACPGSIFEHLLRDGDKTRPFYGQRFPGILFCDPEVATQTIEKLQEADSTGNILVVLAHDSHMSGIVDFFPKYANDFMAKGWVKRTRWRFLRDFKQALEHRAVSNNL
ncbi:putative N-acyl homoserine lactonase AttM [Xylariaceae sp. FL1019]|nr:putative N-acyl homoserine lactonase AttM [Xylariaceae sp. FL1019]